MSDDEEKQNMIDEEDSESDDDYYDPIRGPIFVCPPFKRTRKYNEDNFPGLWFVKWAFPAFCFCVSTFICMWFLHVGTIYYIHVMERQESVTVLLPPTSPNMTTFRYPFLSPGITPNSTSYGSLEDPVEGYLGWTHVDMGILDKVSAALPLAWFVLTIATDDLQHWTKMIICNCFLAILKGLFGFMTVVPDSIGWASCKERLKPEGIKRLKEEIASPKDGFSGVFWSTLTFEVNNLFGKLIGKPNVRFCADMMFSGHTYFTTLYALGLSELARSHTREHFKKNTWVRHLIVGCVYAVCILEQTLEISMVLKNRFHYTMDVAMAILLTFLHFTNGSIGIAAKAWHHWSGKSFSQDDGEHVPKVIKDQVRSLTNDDEGRRVLAWLRKNKKDWVLLPTRTFNKHGDTWTPPCCIPFCCFWGPRFIFGQGAPNVIDQCGKQCDEDGGLSDSNEG